MSPIVESVVEDVTLSCLSDLGYAVLHGQQIAPGTPAAERDALLPRLLSGEIRVSNAEETVAGV